MKQLDENNGENVEVWNILLHCTWVFLFELFNMKISEISQCIQYLHTFHTFLSSF